MSHLTKCASVIKKKTQQLADVKTICEQEARIKTLKAQRAQLQAGQPCPLCGSTSHPAVEAYQALEPGVNQARLLTLEKEVKKARRRRCGAARATGCINEAASAR